LCSCSHNSFSGGCPCTCDITSSDIRGGGRPSSIARLRQRLTADSKIGHSRNFGNVGFLGSATTLLQRHAFPPVLLYPIILVLADRHTGCREVTNPKETAEACHPRPPMDRWQYLSPISTQENREAADWALYPAGLCCAAHGGGRATCGRCAPAGRSAKVLPSAEEVEISIARTNRLTLARSLTIADLRRSFSLEVLERTRHRMGGSPRH
jgi:hypothetical protein